MANFTINADRTILRGSPGDDTFQFSSNLDIVYGVAGNDTFTGSTNSSVLMSGAGYDQFSLNNVDSGNALLGSGSPVQMFIVYGYYNYLSGGGGNAWLGVDTYLSSYNVLDGGAGNAFMGVIGSVNTLIAGAGTDSLQVGNGGNINTLIGGSGYGDFQINGSYNAVSGGSGTDHIFLQRGSYNALHSGLASSWIGANDSFNALIGGAVGGASDWIGASGQYNLLLDQAGNNTLYANGSNNWLAGGTGNDWVGVSGVGNTLLGRSGDDYVAASNNGNILDGGTGNDHLVAAPGHNTDIFVFQRGDGQDDITGFSPLASGGYDVIALQGFGLTFTTLQPLMQQNGNDVVINLGLGDVLTIHNMQVSNLLVSDFNFGLIASSNGAGQTPVGADHTVLTGFSAGPTVFQINSNTDTLYAGMKSGNFETDFTGRTSFSTLVGAPASGSFRTPSVFTLDLSNYNTLLGGDGGDSMFISGGFGNHLVGGNGPNWIGVGPSSTGGTTTFPSANVLQGGDSNDFLGASGALNQLYGGGGDDSLQTVGSSNQLFGGEGNDRLQASGGQNTLDGGNGNDQLFLQSGNSNILNGGNGNDWVGGNGNSNQLLGGDGDDWMGITGNQNRLAGGAGNDSLFANGSNNQLLGGDGNDWVGLSGDNNFLFGGTGDDTVAATGNTNVLDPGAGAIQQVTLGSHSGDTVIFQPGYGNVGVTGFVSHASGGTDVFDIQGFGLATFAQLSQFMSVKGNDTLITLGADVITLHNVTATLSTDFHLA
jgi:Ca2+-binding RTX toxin-like protein